MTRCAQRCGGCRTRGGEPPRPVLRSTRCERWAGAPSPHAGRRIRGLGCHRAGQSLDAPASGPRLAVAHAELGCPPGHSTHCGLGLSSSRPAMAHWRRGYLRGSVPLWALHAKQCCALAQG